MRYWVARSFCRAFASEPEVGMVLIPRVSLRDDPNRPQASHVFLYPVRFFEPAPGSCPRPFISCRIRSDFDNVQNGPPCCLVNADGSSICVCVVYIVPYWTMVSQYRVQSCSLSHTRPACVLTFTLNRLLRPENHCIPRRIYRVFVQSRV